MEKIRWLGCGILIGIANVIPGVSGGTMAVILNIYDPLILAFHRGRLRSSLPFLLLVGGGTALGVLLFSRSITYLIRHYEMATQYAFMGLVAGSIPFLWRKARHKELKKKNWVPFCLALLLMLGLLVINKTAAPDSGAFAPDSMAYPVLAGWLFLSALASTIAMILPGISGSFVLLMLGGYFVTMEAIATVDLSVLLPVAAGILAGGAIGIKVVGLMIIEHPQAMYMGILGLIIGSLAMLFPGLELSLRGMAALAFLIPGAAISWFFGRKNT